MTMADIIVTLLLCLSSFDVTNSLTVGSFSY